MNKKFFTIIFLTVTVFVFYSISDSGQIKGVTEKNLAIYFLDIGQGDATLIRTPEGDDIIIDGGPDNKLVQKLGQYLPFYDRTIETIILTHPHDDQIYRHNGYGGI